MQSSANKIRCAHITNMQQNNDAICLFGKLKIFSLSTVIVQTLLDGGVIFEFESNASIVLCSNDDNSSSSSTEGEKAKASRTKYGNNIITFRIIQISVDLSILR